MCRFPMLKTYFILPTTLRDTQYYFLSLGAVLRGSEGLSNLLVSGKVKN